MDVSNMYVPNASKWIQYYMDGLKRHTFNGKNRNQRGGSLVSGAKTHQNFSRGRHGRVPS